MSFELGLTQAHNKVYQRLVPARIRNDPPVDSINDRQCLDGAELDQVRVGVDLLYGSEETVGGVHGGGRGEDGVDCCSNGGTDSIGTCDVTGSVMIRDRARDTYR